MRPLALVLATFACAAVARGQPPPSPLESARAAYAAGEVEGALRAYTDALATPGNGPGELAEIHFHLGVLHAALGDGEASRRAFAAALAIDATLTAPDELSPAQRMGFDHARAARAAGPMELRVEVRGRDRDRHALRLRVRAANAPPDLVARIEVRDGAVSDDVLGAADVDAAGAIVVTVPCAGVCPLSLVALDTHGGRLHLQEHEVELPAPSPREAAREAHLARDTSAPDAAPGRRSALRSPWLWIAVAAVLAGGATLLYFVLRPDGETTYVIGPPRVEGAP